MKSGRILPIKSMRGGTSMHRHVWIALALALGIVAAGQVQPQVAPASKKAPAAVPKKAAPPASAALSNRDVIRLVQAKVAEDLIIDKIQRTKTNFDTSV